ncbi:MAG: hypothetical protein ACEQSB_03575 [Undibacterium sp.]
MPVQKNTHRYRQFIATLLIGMMVITISAPTPARAGVWGESIASSLLKQVLETIWEQIQAVLFGIAKRVAVGIARDAANRLTAGGMDHKPAFITDYKQFLFDAAIDEGLLYMDDLLTQTMGGKGSVLNYVAGGGSIQALGKQYMSLLNGEVKAGFAADNCKYTLDQYTPNPLSSIKKGDWRVLNAATFPCNNPLGLTNRTKNNVQRRANAKSQQQQIEAIVGKGFTGVKDKNGKTISPGSIIADITADVQTASMKLITGSTKWGELLSSAAGAFVNQALSNMYQKGFEDVSKKINRELGKVDAKLGAARADLHRQLGPGAVFLRNAEQQIGGTGNPGTGKYTGVQTSVVYFNAGQTPDCSNASATGGGC